MVAAVVITAGVIALAAPAAIDAGAEGAHEPAGLTFGIYPGGAAGTVGPAGRLVPDDQTKTLDALERLRVPGRPFVLHLFASYAGQGSASAAEQIGGDVARYTAAGFRIELVLTYRPAGGAQAQDVAGFADFARGAVAGFGSNPRFTALQVTNEANVRGAPSAADGAYAGAQDALVRGVVAAAEEARKDGARVAIGFNWAYSVGASERAFWSRLRSAGPAFRRSLDWVGLDLYPGTWGPRLGGTLASATKRSVLGALSAVRKRYLPLAGLAANLPIHISENGYPTGPRRTEAMQLTELEAAVSTVASERSAYGVTDYRWFDLRDADSSSPSFESRYGLMDDHYRPKAAFAAYRKLVATYSPGASRLG
jgi:hypothetical protein